MVQPLPALTGLSNWIDPRRQALLGLASGLVQGQNFGEGLGLGFERAAQGRQYDDAYATSKKEEAERSRQLNETIRFLQGKGMEDLVPLVEAGQSDLAISEALKRSEPQAQTPLDIREVGGDVLGFDPYSGESRTLYNGPDAMSTEPPRVETRYSPETGLEERVVWNPSTGGWDAFGGTKAPAATTRPMDATTRKELFEAEDAVTAGDYVLSALDQAITLNDKAYEGPFADVRGDAAALVGNEEGVATAQLKNVTTELALSQLKTIFGAMPTEGERKILLELQGSVNMPRAVRAEIFKRAKQMAIRRIEDNKRKAAGLRSGEYFDPAYGVSDGAAGDGWQVIGVE